MGCVEATEVNDRLEEEPLKATSVNLVASMGRKLMLISLFVIRSFSSHTYEESVTVSQELQLSGERETEYMILEPCSKSRQIGHKGNMTVLRSQGHRSKLLFLADLPKARGVVL